MVQEKALQNLKSIFFYAIGFDFQVSHVLPTQQRAILRSGRDCLRMWNEFRPLFHSNGERRQPGKFWIHRGHLRNGILRCRSRLSQAVRPATSWTFGRPIV
jgi:hypothetical protein